MNHVHWIGFARISDLLECARRFPETYSEVYAMAISELPRTPEFARVTTYLRVTVLDHERPDVVRYWQLRLGATLMDGGKPMDHGQLDRLKAVSRVAEECIADIIRTSGPFIIRRGTLSPPDDLALIEGSADEIDWDPETGKFRLRDAAPEATEGT